MGFRLFQGYRLKPDPIPGIKRRRRKPVGIIYFMKASADIIETGRKLHRGIGHLLAANPNDTGGQSDPRIQKPRGM